MNQIISIQEWAKIFNDWKVSGLTRREFCLKNGLNLDKFRYYRDRLNYLKMKEQTNEKQDQKNQKPEFIPINITAPVTTTSLSKIKIYTHKGVALEINDDLATINKMLDLLEHRL